jgi:hypothetical protein
MRFLSLTVLALATLTVPALAQQEPAGDIVVHGAAARQEIERILREDSLTSSRPTPREVAETMAIIARGRAPEDFWTAYQTHVQAWQRYAEVVEQSPQQGQQGESTFGAEGEAGEAQQAIESTFVEVERIARRYGARLPAAPIDPRTIA